MTKEEIRALRVQMEAGEARRKKLAALVGTCLNHMVGQQLLDSGQIGSWDVKYWPNLRGERGVDAGTFPLDDGFAIGISTDMQDEDMVRIAAHESVHLAQYFRGDAKKNEVSGFTWLGIPQNLLPPDDPLYPNQPWEEEAYRLAVDLEQLLDS